MLFCQFWHLLLDQSLEVEEATAQRLLLLPLGTLPRTARHHHWEVEEVVVPPWHLPCYLHWHPLWDPYLVAELLKGLLLGKDKHPH